MPVLLELYCFWTYKAGGGLVQVCPACGEPLDAGQAVAGFTNRWTRLYYVVHEWCEVPLHALLTQEEQNERNIQATG